MSARFVVWVEWEKTMVDSSYWAGCKLPCDERVVMVRLKLLGLYMYGLGSEERRIGILKIRRVHMHIFISQCPLAKDRNARHLRVPDFV